MAPGTLELAWVQACALQVITQDMAQSIRCIFGQHVYTVTSGSDLCRTCNADSDRCPKRGQTSEDKSEQRRIEAGLRLNVDKHAGGP